ncbi:hypothetical protein OAS39_00720 [Pirellulales bacterium]|nr:hypothetical protein [Pirellulales bacterium]
MKISGLLVVALMTATIATAAEEAPCRGLCPTADCARVGNFQVEVAPTRVDDLGGAAPETVALQKAASAGKSAKGSAVRPLAENTRVAEAKAPSKACGLAEDGTRIACSAGDEAFSDVAVSRPARDCRLAAPAVTSRYTESAPCRHGLCAKESPKKIAPESL